MLVVVSPAKKLDMTSVDAFAPTEPAFAKDAKALAKIAKELSVQDLQNLMHISEALAKLNVERFRDFGKMERKAAALAFAGDTYQGLEAGTLDADEMAWAQEHLGILSGLYGVLRPLDAIEPYRLEMGSRLQTPKGKNLYDYWGSKISTALNARAKEIGTDVLINCASQEYFGAVDRSALKLRVITPVFMEDKAGQPKIVSFYAKRARGAMARFIIQRRLVDAASIVEFDSGGYEYQPKLSKPESPVFIRPAVA